MKVYGVLHTADLIHDPKMWAPTLRDWAKIPFILRGEWPKPFPPVLYRGFDPVAERVWWDQIMHAPWVVIDTEYVPETQFMTMLGMGYPDAPVFQARSFAGDLRRKLATVIDAVPIVFQNCMADLPILETTFGLQYEDFHQIEDLMLAHAVLWSEWPHGLEFLASVYGQHEKRKHLNSVDLSAYNAGDVVDTLDAWAAIHRELGRDPQSDAIYRQQSLKLVPVLLHAKRRGIRVNHERVRQAQEAYQLKNARAYDLAQSYVGRPFNVGSSTQLSHFLYRETGFPPQKHKKTRAPTTDQDAITALRQRLGPSVEQDEDLTWEQVEARIAEGAHPVLESRVLYADAVQALSHYITPLFDGGAIRERIYPQVNIHAQVSGRFSITHPPLGQLPDDLRDIICPDPGETWLSWDWKQIEPRLLEVLAGDDDALARWDEDRYERYTSVIFPGATPMDPLWAVKRQFTKRFQLRLNYRGDPKRSGDIPGAKLLGLGRQQLGWAATRYLAARPALAQYWRRLEAEAQKANPQSRTFLGRLRRFSRGGPATIREAFNHPMQGGVADIKNITILRLCERFPWLSYVYDMHDSVTMACPTPRVAETQPEFQWIVEQPWIINQRVVYFPAVFSVRT